MPFTRAFIRAASRLPSASPAPLAGRRYASSAASLPRRFLSTTLVLGGSVAFVAYYYDSRSLLHEHIVMPIVRLYDAEVGHRLAVRVLGAPWFLRPKDLGVDTPELGIEIFGLPISNPVGMAAGFDKDGEAIDGLFDLGFGYVEIGSVTPEPQPGNPLPRFFRLEEDQACINRYGFNSLGHGQALGQLRARIQSFARSNPSSFPYPLPSLPIPPANIPRSLRPGHVLAVNLGKNKTSSADSNEDYVKGVRTLGPYADVVVINVSSPNTPGLRALQGRQILTKLLSEVVEERDRIKSPEGLPKIAVKVACDLNEDELGDVAAAVRKSGVDGVIVSNTTIRREGLRLLSDNQGQTGGLSGKPLFPYALDALKTLRPLLPPSTPIIGCGGISSGSDAIQMAESGASLVQVYTLFGYRGVGTARLLKDEISQELKGRSWKSIVGSAWTGGEMGWDEKRLEKESEALKNEAKGLGDLLRHIDEKEGTQRLIAEAEAALKKPMENAPSSAPVARDNQLGAEKGPTPIKDVSPDIGNQLQQAIQRAIDKPKRSSQAETSASNANAASRKASVADAATTQYEDEFTRTVRSGDRRLV